jgi:hypothetical protein
MSLDHPYFRVKPVYYLCFVLASTLVVGLGWLLASQPVAIRELPVIEYNTYRCSTGNAGSDRVLRVFEVRDASSEQLADALCMSKVVGELFSAVEVRWQHHARTDIRNLYEQRFDLGVGRPQVIEKPEVRKITSYVPIAGYPEYASYLISLTDTPVLSADYLSGKRLGLIHNTESLAGYQVPRRAMAGLGIAPATLQITYYRNHDQLRQALLQGNVDLIASSWLEEKDSVLLAGSHRLLLDSGIAGARWYLLPEWIDTPLHCVVAGLLKSLASDSSDPALRQLELSRDCRR